MRSVIDERVKVVKEYADKLVESGVNVVLCQKDLDDLAGYYLAKNGIMALRQVKFSDFEKAAKATGAKIVSNIYHLTKEDLGYSKLAEARKIGDSRWFFIEGCKNPKSVTILIRSGTKETLDEAERSIKDAIHVVKDIVEKPKIVAGGGAVEVKLTQRLRRRAAELPRREQLAIEAFADALEAIPLALAENIGLSPLDTIVELRSLHGKDPETWVGINAFTGRITDMAEAKVYEPLAVKEQIVKSAFEAATMILNIDEVVFTRKSKTEPSKEAGEKKEDEESSE